MIVIVVIGVVFLVLLYSVLFPTKKRKVRTKKVTTERPNARPAPQPRPQPKEEEKEEKIRNTFKFKY